MSDDKPRTPPIEPLDYLSGVKVVDIGDLRVARGETRRPYSSCSHSRMTYDQRERRIWCKDCERDVEPFDAFVLLVSNYRKGCVDLDLRKARIEEAEQFRMRTIAAVELDKAWRGRSMVPSCPHCRRGLLPEDFKFGVTSQVSREWELALRNKAKKD